MTTKDERLQVRVDPTVKRALEEAATVTHQTLSSFVLQAAQLRAEEILAERAVITLTPAASDVFNRALAEPAAVNERLAAALKRPQKFRWLD